MTKWLSILLNFLTSLFQTRHDLAFENLLLRQQLAVLKEKGVRPQLSATDRSLWVLVSRIWPRWRDALHIVKPETVVRWHREGSRRHWTQKCRKKGRPELGPRIRLLIKRMSQANPLWGAPRIQGELLKLGIDVSETNVTESPTAEWTARQILEAVGLEDAPKYLIRDQDSKFSENFSRQVASIGIKEILTAPASPWQNAYAERVIGTVRRECLDHMIILGEQHLRRTGRSYSDYYNRFRTHLSLDKDSPKGRIVQFPDLGAIRSRRHCGGLHHEYYRRAA